MRGRRESRKALGDIHRGLEEEYLDLDLDDPRTEDVADWIYAISDRPPGEFTPSDYRDLARAAMKAVVALGQSEENAAAAAAMRRVGRAALTAAGHAARLEGSAPAPYAQDAAGHEHEPTT
jgi:hypothetical protein